MTLQTTTPKRWRLFSWTFATAVGLVTLAAFLPSLANGWVQWDDGTAFLSNPNFRGLGSEHLRWMWTTFELAIYRPLTWMTYGADFLLWGLEPSGYHLTSLLIHTLNALLAYLLSLRIFAIVIPAAAGTGRLAMSAAIAALLFAIHPLRAEPVAWISARADLLSTTFVLLATLGYFRHCAASPDAWWRSRWLLVATFMYALSLLAKPMALTFPLVLVILDIYPLRRLGPATGGWLTPRARKVWLEKAPFLAVALAMAPVIYLAKSASMITVAGSRVLLGFAMTSYNLAFYLWKTLVPHGLSPMYELSYRVVIASRPFLLSAAAVLSLTAILVWKRRAWPGALAVWLIYALVLIPVSGIIPFSAQMGADRYTYLACLGWAVLAGAGLLALLDHAATGRSGRPVPFALAFAAFGAVAYLSALTWKQTQVWRDTGTLWSHAVAVESRSALVRANYAQLLAEKGDLEGAYRHFELATRLDPESADSYVDVVAVLYALDRPGEARQPLERLMALTPDSALAYRKVGNALLPHNRLDDARRYFERALLHAPNDFESANGLGVIFARQGNLEEAERSFRRALASNPRHAASHNNLANALLGQGRIDEAVIEYRAGVAAAPGSAEARVNLADALVASRDFAAAVEQYRHAIAIEPRHARAHNNLGFVLMMQGRLSAAVRYLERAVRIAPDFPGARQNLEVARARLAAEGTRGEPGR